MTTVGIYDPLRLRQDLVKSYISGIPNVKVLFSHTRMNYFLEQVSVTKADVLVIVAPESVSQFGNLFRKLAQFQTLDKVVLLSNRISHFSHEIIRKGSIGGCLVMDSMPVALSDAIAEVSLIKQYFCTEVSSYLVNLSKLDLRVSTREREILSLIAKDHSSKEIADKLFISIHTVHSYRKNLLRKFESRGSVGLVRKAMENGFI